MLIEYLISVSSTSSPRLAFVNLFIRLVASKIRESAKPLNHAIRQHAALYLHFFSTRRADCVRQISITKSLTRNKLQESMLSRCTTKLNSLFRVAHAYTTFIVQSP